MELRRQQLEAWKTARPEQPALFALKEDSRPAAERSAAGRYREPTFLDRVRQARWTTRRPDDAIQYFDYFGGRPA